MKLFSWLNDEAPPQNNTKEESSDDEPSLSPVLQARLAELETVNVTNIMIPRSVVQALDADVQLRRVRRLKSAKVAHFPVYKGDLDHILGWISKAKVLEILTEPSDEPKLEKHVRPVGQVLEEATVSDLADIFLKAASPFLVVKNAQGMTTGIVMLADFVELIFGFELSPPQPAAAVETPAPRLSSFEI
jgi:putative hemolysin